MDYIELLKQENITFKLICEVEANIIMKQEYSYYDLLKYAILFPKYEKGILQGKYVNLDFGQLYYLAKIDVIFSKLIMGMCLEIERSLKARFICDADSICDTKGLLIEYYNSDKEYLEQSYNSSNYDAIDFENIKDSIDNLSLEQFLYTIKFGTFERMYHFFYRIYSFPIYKTEFAPYEKNLASIRRIRNIVAHNNSIISKLCIHSEVKNVQLLAYLGRKGIRHKTLRTNMSKMVISDLCNLFYVYFAIVSDWEVTVKEFHKFENEVCEKYKKYFQSNDMIKSVYNFLREVIKIFIKESGNDLT